MAHAPPCWLTAFSWKIVAVVFRRLHHRLAVSASRLDPLDYFFGVGNPATIVISALSAFGSLLLTIVAGFAHDSTQQEMERKP